MTDSPQIISVVVPVFNEHEVIGVFYERISAVLNSLDSMRHELIFIDDGSADDTYGQLKAFADDNPTVRIVKLSRNFGHQIAVTAGLDAAHGDAIVVIDADLQDPPEIIPDLIRKWNEGFDVVHGVRKVRAGETRLKIITASIFYRCLKMVAKIDVAVDSGDFRLMSRRVVDQFKNIRERDRFIRGLVSWIGFRQTSISYARDRRHAGHTKYSYSKMFRFAFDAITSFSSVPLKLATWLGYLSSLLAFVYACSVFVQKYILHITEKGWPTIMISVLFLGGVQLICIGIVGEYIGRIYNEIKQRPLYIVDKLYNRADAPDDPARSEAVHPVSASKT